MKLTTRTIITAVDLTEAEVNALEDTRKILIEIGDGMGYSDEDFNNLSDAIELIDTILNDNLINICVIKPTKKGE